MCDFNGFMKKVRIISQEIIDNCLRGLIGLVPPVVGLTVLLYFANVLIYGLRGDFEPLKELAPLCFQLAGFTFVSTIFESRPGNKVPNLIQNLVRASVLFFLAGFFFLYVQNYAAFANAVKSPPEGIGGMISGYVFAGLFFLGLLCLESALLIFGIILKDVMEFYVVKGVETSGKLPSPKRDKTEKSKSRHARA